MTQTEYWDKDQMIEIVIIEGFNILITAPFLFIFAYRFYILKPVSITYKYKSSYPRFRVLISICYILTSIANLTKNIINGISEQWPLYIYFLGGGFGATINSIVLAIQLIVLRLELLKEQPYTSFHLLYAIALIIASGSRTFFVCFFNNNDQKLSDTIFSSILTFISAIQLIYWALRRQSLPQFLLYKDLKLGDILQNKIVDFNSQTSQIRSIPDNFPYLIPQITVKYGKFNITLEMCSKKSNILAPEVGADQHQAHLSPLIIREQSPSDIISDHTYNLNQLVEIYTLCGKLNIAKEVSFDQGHLLTLAQDFQIFLECLLIEKQNYLPDILEHLKLSKNQIQSYFLLRNSFLEGYHRQNQEKDHITGLYLPFDNNGIYYSVHIYKYKWVMDHFVFYLKINSERQDVVTYPAKRYSEFQHLHSELKNIIKKNGRQIELPPKPKKHFFHFDDLEAVKKRKKDLQKYLKRMTNDPIIMEEVDLKEKILTFLNIDPKMNIEPQFKSQFYHKLEIVVGEIKKVMINKDITALYFFKLIKEGDVIREIERKWAEFEELHNEIQRWMNNSKIHHNLLLKPPNNLKSDAERQQFMKMYLSNLIKIEGIEKVYCINAFFNAGNNPDKRVSEISYIDHYENEHKNLKDHPKVTPKDIELTEHSPVNLHRNSSRISRILDDPGNEIYD